MLITFGICLLCYLIYRTQKAEMPSLEKTLDDIELDLVKEKVKSDYYKSECELTEGDKIIADIQIEQMINKKRLDT